MRSGSGDRALALLRLEEIAKGGSRGNSIAGG